MNTVIPWPLVRVFQLGRLIGGGTPSRKQSDYFAGSIPWITSQDIPEHQVIELTEARDHITKEAIAESATKLVPAGSVLVSTRVTVGKTAVAAQEMCFSQDITAIVIDNPSLVEPMYLAQCLRAKRTSLLQKNQGSTIAGITKDTLGLEEIPLPPISEQRRIVAILQEAEAVRQIRQSLGRTTERLGLGSFFSIFGEPDSWKTGVRLNDAVKFVGGGTPSRGTTHFFSGDIPWATPKDMGELYLQDTEEHISEEAIESSATNAVPKGTVLVVVKSKILARTLPLAITPRRMCFGQDLKGLIPKDGIPPELVVYSMRAQMGRILSRARGANTEGLTLDDLKPLPFPTLDENRLSRFQEAIAAIQAVGESTAREPLVFQSLQASLSAHAFSGTLTATWRDHHRDQLAHEAAERDGFLAAQGATTTRPVDIHISGKLLKTGKDLTTEQQFVYMRCQREPGESPYVTAQLLAKELDGRIRNDARTIDGHLMVLADRGLLIPVSQEIDNPDAGTIYARAYRLPREDGDDGPGDRAKTAELARLASLCGGRAR